MGAVYPELPVPENWFVRLTGMDTGECYISYSWLTKYLHIVHLSLLTGSSLVSFPDPQWGSGDETRSSWFTNWKRYIGTFFPRAYAT